MEEHCRQLIDKYPGSMYVANPAQVFYCACYLFKYSYRTVKISTSMRYIPAVIEMCNDSYDSYCDNVLGSR